MPTPQSPRAGVPPKVSGERLDHENPALTLKQYAHVVPGMQTDAARQTAQLVRGIDLMDGENH